MAYLSLSLLGPFQAWTANGVSLQFRTTKERALLAYLIVESNHSHRREKLAQLFWPDRAEGVARNNLRQALFGIRQAIGGTEFDQIFLVSADDVRVDVDQLWLDLAAFQMHIKAYTQHNHEMPEPCSSCLQHARDAVEIYRSSFLEDLFLDKNPEFREWIAARRETYIRMQIEALEFLITSYERSGDYYQAIPYAVRQQRLDDLKEANYRRLMMYLLNVGRSGAALEQYEIYLRKLKETSSLPPDPKMVELAEQIRQGGFEPALSMPNRPANNLPDYLTPFIGREMEMLNLSQLLENPGCRLLNLVGLGGVGKTRLAVQSAGLNLALFPDGIYFIPLDTIQSEYSFFEKIAQVVGLVPGPQQLIRTVLLDYLRLKHVLLILDNFEQLIDSKGLLLEILQAAPYVKILLTSRERLAFQAEYLIHLDGLPFPVNPDLDGDGEKNALQPVQFSAVELFLERAGRLRSAVQGAGAPAGQVSGSMLADNGSQEMEAVVRICQLVDGLPLGIELAASWARDYSFTQIADEVQRSFEFLETSMQDIPERQRSLRVSFEHSWDLLPENEREALCRLTVFPASFTAGAALAVAGAAMPWLMRLEDRSLIRRVTFGRYGLHPLIRQYAGQKLHQFSRRVEDQALQQHAQYFCSFLKEHEMDLKGHRQAAALDEIECDWENIHAAWVWSIEHRAASLLESAAFGVMYFLEIRSRWREGEESFRQAVAALERTSHTSAEQNTLAFLMAYQGWFLCRLTSFEQAESLLSESLRRMSEDFQREERAFAHFALGFLYIWMGRFQEAALHLTTSLEVAEKAGDAWGQAWARQVLNEISFESGKIGLHAEPFLSTLANFDQAGDQRGSSRALNYLGNIAMAQGKYEDARIYFEKLLTIAEKIGDIWGAGGGYSKLGQLAFTRGDYDKALRFHLRSLSLIQKTGDQRRTAFTLGELGEVAAVLGKCNEADQYFHQALEIAARLHNSSLAQEMLTRIAAVLLREPDKQRGTELLILILSDSLIDQLTASRAIRLAESIQLSIPVKASDAPAEPTSSSQLWNIVDEFLRRGVK